MKPLQETDLDATQQSRVANLLAQLSAGTAESILSRFDRGTGDGIRSRLAHDKSASDDTATSVLREFAEFLYYLPAPSQSTGRQSRRGVSRVPADATSELVTVEMIMNLDDASIDVLLESIAPELTIRMLCCSRESFIRRVLSRLDPDEASSVIEQINASEPPGFAEMKSVHRRYCQIASDLVAQGLIELNIRTASRPAEPSHQAGTRP